MVGELNAYVAKKRRFREARSEISILVLASYSSRFDMREFPADFVQLTQNPDTMFVCLFV